MTVRRHVLNLGGKTVDVRIGVEALEELPRMLKGVVGAPRRAALVHAAALDEAILTTVRRALIDVGFKIEDVALAPEVDVSRAEAALTVWSQMTACGLTKDDLLVGVGDAPLCSLVAFCAHVWCGGMSSALIPLTLDAMVTAATVMRPLSVGAGPAVIETTPMPTLVVSDVSLLDAAPVDDLRLGYVTLMGSMLADSRKNWDAFGALIPRLNQRDALATIEAISIAQLGRRGVLMSAVPAARNALTYGVETARALRSCLGDNIPWYALLAEGMRFEARLAVDAAKLNPDIVFEQDDRFEDLGIEELRFTLDAEALIQTLKAVMAERSNRFMLALPKIPGTIRLTSVPDDVLERHAQAYVASRREA